MNVHLILDPTKSVIFLSMFYFFGFMLIWSFYQVIRVDPGRVPIYWVYDNVGLSHGRL